MRTNSQPNKSLHTNRRRPFRIPVDRLIGRWIRSLCPVPATVGELWRSVKTAMTMRLVILFILTSLTLEGADIRYFNPEIFGKSVNEPVTLLLPGDAESLHPFTIMTDIKDGRYFATTVNYSKKITLEDVRKALNKRYKQYEKASFSTNALMGLWRNEDDRYAIQLTENEDSIQVFYLSFMKFSEAWKHLQDTYPKESPIGVLLRKIESEKAGATSTEQ